MSEQFIERRIIIGLITNDEFLRFISEKFQDQYFQPQAANTIASWCIRHFNIHNKSPQKDIELIFGSYKRRNILTQEQIEDIDDILTSLSGEYETNEYSLSALIDETINYFDEQKVIKLADEIRQLAEQGDLSQAKSIIEKYSPFEKEEKSDPDFFANNIDRTRKIFEEVSEPIIEYPGKLGNLLNRHFVKGGFVGFLGQEKVGKTWILMDIAFQAMKNGRSVAFFAAGDMNREEMELRKYIHLARRSNEAEFCKELLIPVADCWKNQTGECQSAPGSNPFIEEKKPFKLEGLAKNYLPAFKTYSDHIPCTKCAGTHEYIGAPWFRIKEKCEPLTWKEGYEIERKFVKTYRGGKWRFAEYPADTLTTRMIDNKLDEWQQDGFDADVILVDYPDIMAIEKDDQRKDFRHGENSKWKKLRAMAHRRNAFVAAVTQADGKALGKEWISLDNYSEDKRKYSHATAFFGLNQTDDEAELGLFRINQLMVRSGKRGKKYVTVLQRLEIGRAFLGSY